MPNSHFEKAAEKWSEGVSASPFGPNASRHLLWTESLLLSVLSFALWTFLLLASALPAGASGNIHTTWLWHLHQPIYWPDRRDYGIDHYENAWDTIQQQNAGRPDPSPEVLSTIFGEADRQADYQNRPHDALSGLLGYADAGAQMNFSGALMENVQSLGAAGQLGYAGNWNSYNQQAAGWSTSGGKTRLDLVNFTYHHALAPLISDETLKMELLLHQRQMQIFWGTNRAGSRGYFPAETCFTERMIPILSQLGIAWTVVANNHLTRSCADFPLVLGSGGENCDIPNPADQLNPAQGASNYETISIERGCAPTAAMPFAFQVHYARYVDPNTGAASVITVVPSDQALSWRDSYGTWDLGLMDALAARNVPSKPAIALFAHDGDNAWSGGYSYYMQWTSQFASEAGGLGYTPSTVEQFLLENPPATNDVVHVEDGGWVFADSDFGSPIFINWHWPPSYTSSSGANVVDPSLGVSEKADNWRVIVATENRVKTAQQVAGLAPRIDQVRDPGSFGGTPNAVELGWHYYLASLDSGFVYYGCTGDECERAAIAQSNAVRNVDGILSTNPSADTTPPTLFPPQRHPWNPGGTNFGVQYGYKATVATNTDFWIWTYGYDVSGITNVSLLLRVNGTNPPASDQFKTYSGGALTGPWLTTNMTKRVVSPSLGITPQYIADYYYVKVSGISNAFVDYYISGTDSLGNTYKSPIEHVWVASGQPGSVVSGNGCNGRVCVSPSTLAGATPVTVLFYPAGGPLTNAAAVDVHLGWNGWDPVVSPDAAMTFDAASNYWEYTVMIPATSTQLNCVFNNGSGLWDNNNGQNWNFTVVSNSTPEPPAQPQNLALDPVQTTQINLTWAAASGAAGYLVNRAGAPLALTTGTNYSDTGLSTNTSYCYSIVASNGVGFSTPSATVCTNTLAVAPATYVPFVLDGAFDYPGYLVASNSMVLYAALRGTKLYVATESTGTDGPNDNFIFVSDQLLAGATAIAPWAKAGYVAVATNKPYLASESQNTYISWTLNGAATNFPCAKSSSSSGAMEGTLDLVQAFGVVPTNIYLCAAAYVTTNGGPLVMQCPAGSGTNIQPSAFFVIPTVALSDSTSDGFFDRLQPAVGFVLQSIRPVKGGYAVNWASMPGRNYQLLSAAQLGGAWSNLPATLSTAGPLQLLLGCTDVPPASATQRFYRVKLLP